MRTKRVNRYYCDFCRKAGCSSGHMQKHERHCTMNPDRECRFCAAVDGKQIPIATLIAALPTRTVSDFDPLGSVDIGALREVSSNCPACILAAIRQAKLPVYLVQDFDFKKEVAEFWAERNNERLEHETYY